MVLEDVVQSLLYQFWFGTCLFVEQSTYCTSVGRGCLRSLAQITRTLGPKYCERSFLTGSAHPLVHGLVDVVGVNCTCSFVFFSMAVPRKLSISNAEAAKRVCAHGSGTTFILSLSLDSPPAIVSGPGCRTVWRGVYSACPGGDLSTGVRYVFVFGTEIFTTSTLALKGLCTLEHTQRCIVSFRFRL